MSIVSFQSGRINRRYLDKKPKHWLISRFLEYLDVIERLRTQRDDAERAAESAYMRGYSDGQLDNGGPPIIEMTAREVVAERAKEEAF